MSVAYLWILNDFFKIYYKNIDLTSLHHGRYKVFMTDRQIKFILYNTVKKHNKVNKYSYYDYSWATNQYNSFKEKGYEYIRKDCLYFSAEEVDKYKRTRLIKDIIK